MATVKTPTFGRIARSVPQTLAYIDQRAYIHVPVANPRAIALPKAVVEVWVETTPARRPVRDARSIAAFLRDILCLYVC